MPITLNNSNISIQYNTGSNYIIDTVKSDLYRKNDMVDTIIRDNIQTAPVTPTTFVDNSGNVYAVESYTYSGTANTKDYTRVFPKNTTCDILIVGGGGGGGQQNAGGGGAGGLVLVQNLQANGSFTINVGKGGNGGISQSRGSVGNNSTFIKSDNSVIITANGGGGGGSTGISGQGDGLLATNGGSGGGGGYYLANGTQTQKSQSQIGVSSPAILNQFGEDGGHGGGSTSSYPGGGGGGAGGVGATSTSDTIGQNGGQGIDRVGTFVFSQAFLSSIGDNGWFAGGGGSGGAGASDGYGNGGSSLFGGGGNGDGIGRGINGINGTGGGGGSVREPGSTLGGNGGSGIVIIRYLLGTINYLTPEPTINPSIIATNVYYPKVPATNSFTWTDSGYTVNVKVSDTALGSYSVYYLFNHIITTNPATGGDDYYHSQQIYTGAGNTYNGVTRFKTFAGIAMGVDYGRSIYPKRMRIAPHQSSSVNNAFPKAFKIFASDDASCWNDNNHSSWTQIHDQTTTLTITNGQYTIVNFADNLPKYRYYTMVVLSVIGIYSTGGYLVFAEWNIGGDEKIDAIPEGNPVTHKTLNFTYVPPPLIYDFTTYNTRATWLAYAATIPTFTTSELDYMFDPFDPDSVFLSNTRVGWVQMTLPSTHNFFTITYGLGTQAVEPVRLLVNGVIKSTYGTINSVTTYSQAYNVGDVVRIEEGLSTMSGNFIFQFTNTNSTTNTYTLSVQPGTSIQVNNQPAQYLSGNYTITVGATQSSVLGLSGQTNPYPLTNGSSIAIKYYLLGINNYLTSEPTVSPTIAKDIAIFTHSGGAENQTPHSIYFPENTVCDILIVGGGGGGGADAGGGGGGGQVLFYTNDNVSFKSGNAITLNAGIYNINIGKGGGYAPNTSVNGIDGQVSSIIMNGTTILSAGGGGGGGTQRMTITGNNAIGGGGGNGHANNTTSTTGGTSSAGGGTGGDNADVTGGGGGGGANITGTLKNGQNGTSLSSGKTGNGGQGTDIIINGIVYGVGGGGSGGTWAGSTNGYPNMTVGSATHGGGVGGNDVNFGSNGTSGTGGGGGGGGWYATPFKLPGNGGSGIVIIRVISPTTNKYLFFNYSPAQPLLNYTLTFPTRTMVNFLSNNLISRDELMNGEYTLSVRTTQSTITPTQGQNLQDRLYFTSNFSIRYNVLNPIKTAEGAQWTYNSSNTSVYHMGNVGIGTKNPEYQLDVRGNIYSSTGGFTQSGLTTWTVLSDRRIKENVVKASYEKCLENVKNIELYNFNFKENYVSTNDRHQLGFIAQEVKEVYPKAVEVGKMSINAGNAGNSGDTNDIIENILTLNTTQIDYTLYGAVKNLIEKVENLEDELQYIENDL